MKNDNELCEKYFDAYKMVMTLMMLNEAKKKEFDCKPFKLVDKTDKESKLDQETKNVFKEIENREKGFDKKGFMKYLTTNLLH